MKNYLQNRLTGDTSSVWNTIIRTFTFSIVFLVLFLACSMTLNAQPVIALETVANGFNGPLDLLHAGDARLFIVEQDGVIKIIDENGTTLPTPFLDIDAQVNSNGNEQGLLGMAFHPNYTENGYFFVHYSKSNGDTRISRFSVSEDNPNIADPDSELIILEVSQPYSNHNGGCLKFGPDGYLYIGLGDGGAGGDPLGNGQNRQTFLAKMLRIDIDNGTPYSIPVDNPFTDEDSTLDEIWAIGLRNPWRFSFDRLTGDLWIGDVGQNDWEEVDFQSADSPGGENYGWRCFEGDVAYNNDSNDCPSESELTFPVSVFSNSFVEGCSITGGYVYRGSAFPSMYGYYFYTDYCSGKIWTTIQENGEWVTTEVLDENTFGFSSFGEDVNGELYITDLSSGKIHHIIMDCPDYFISAMLENETCIGDGNGSISVIDATDFSIQWSTGETTATISNLTSGDYFVTLTNEGGCVYTKQFIITNSTPSAPSIVIENVTELSVNDSYETYQWHIGGEVIDGETAGSITAGMPGFYFVEVGSLAGCTINSDTVEVILLGLEALGLTHFSVDPTPFVESINIKIKAQEGGEYTVKIQSLDGKIVYESEEYITAFLQKNISLKNLTNGAYLLILEKNNQQFIRKLIKQ